jgi:rhodanese-related sulfurtransferase
MRQMTPGELKQHLTEGRGNPLLLDVREPWEARICRIEGARLLPMRHIPSALSELNPRRETVLICHHGIRSRQVALFLEHQGFTNVINLEGGLAAWSREVDPAMATY